VTGGERLEPGLVMYVFMDLRLHSYCAVSTEIEPGQVEVYILRRPGGSTAEGRKSACQAVRKILVQGSFERP